MKIQFLAALIVSLALPSFAFAGDSLSGKTFYCESGDPGGGGPSVDLVVDSTERPSATSLSDIHVSEHGRSYDYQKPRKALGEVEVFGQKFQKAVYKLSSRRSLELYWIDGDEDSVWVKLVRPTPTDLDTLSCQVL